MLKCKSDSPNFFYFYFLPSIHLRLMTNSHGTSSVNYVDKNASKWTTFHKIWVFPLTCPNVTTTTTTSPIPDDDVDPFPLPCRRHRPQRAWVH